jgi:CHAD domain-containing protein
VAVAELSFDDVAVFGPDAASQAEASGSDEAHTPVAKWRELELELADPAERAPFEELHRFFSRQDRLVAARASKLERAFTLLATHPAGSAPGVLGVQTWQPMAEAGRVVWRQQLAAVLLNEAGARRGDDIEYVHDMRVATRRARSAARLFGAYYEERAVEELLAAMRKTAETLGAVRDLDVQLDKLARFAKTAPAEVAPDLEVIAAAWREERQAATAALFEWLDSKAYRRFIRDWARFCHTAGLGAHSLQRKSRPSPVPAQVRHVMPSRIMERYEQVRCYEALFEGGEPIPEATLHALRIDCKRLRYVLEPVLHLLNRDGPALVRQLKGLQDHLGDLNDAAVTRARLQELQKRVDHPAVEHYLAVQEEIIAELGRTFPEVWAPFITTSNRRLMARAIARL